MEPHRSNQEIAPSPPSIPPLIWGIVGLAMLVRACIAWTTGFTAEDTFISLRYAENLGHGHGFVYNLGERVLGTTTPLYTLLLALAASLGLPALTVGKAANILADGALCVVVFLWVRRLLGTAEGVVAAFLAAFYPVHIRWAISGMETSLATLCGIVAWWTYTQRRYTAMVVILAVLFLLRCDSALLLGLLTLGIIVRERRFPAGELALFALLIAPWLLFATWYFGSPIPASVLAKVTVYRWHTGNNPLPQGRYFLQEFFGSRFGLLLFLLAMIGVYRIMRHAQRQNRALLLLPLVWMVLYWAVFLLSRVMLFGWYYVPTLPVYELMIAAGVVTVANWLKLPQRRVLQPILAGTLACLLFLNWTLRTWAACRNDQVAQSALFAGAGDWLRRHTPATDVVLTESIGYIGYYSRHPILDSVGLVTPKVLPSWQDRNASPVFETVAAFHPDWCVLAPGEVEQIQKLERMKTDWWASHYALAYTMHYPIPAQKYQPTLLFYHRVPDIRTSDAH